MQYKQIGGIISSIKAISITFIVSPLKLLLDTLIIRYTTIVVKRFYV